MNLKRLSLRTRIFIGMILLVLMASVLIASVAIYQYKEETKDYHKQRLERKEKAIQSHINFVLKETSYPVTTKEIPLIFKDEIYKISWYMRGGVTAQELLHIYSYEDRTIMSNIIKDNIE